MHWSCHQSVPVQGEVTLRPYQFDLLLHEYKVSRRGSVGRLIFVNVRNYVVIILIIKPAISSKDGWSTIKLIYIQFWQKVGCCCRETKLQIGMALFLPLTVSKSDSIIILFKD